MKYFDVMDGDEWVFTGTYEEIAKKFGLTCKSLREIFSRGETFKGKYKLYYAEMVGEKAKKKKIKKERKYNEYAVYKGEELLEIGTVKELALKFNVAEKTVWYWISPTSKRKDKGKRKIGVVLNEEEE